MTAPDEELSGGVTPDPQLPPHQKPSDELRPGDTLADRYRVEGLLGAGGMGMVYKACDTELDISVAIKVLPGVLARNGASVSALKREATLSLRLSHPHVCRLHHFQAGEDMKFLVMELIDGKTLEEVLDQANDRRLSVATLTQIAADVAAALDYAHDLDPPILHLDIKPSNIMVQPNRRAKVLDFGIARQMKDSMTRVTGRETSGTLLYMAPEQYEGRDPTPASDVYAFAATLYECLAGHAPFHQGAIGHQVLNIAAGDLPGVPAYVNKAILDGLAKNPQDRPATAKALVAMLTSGGVPAGDTSATRTRPAISLAQTIVTKSISAFQVNDPAASATGNAPLTAAGPAKPKGWRVGGMLLEPWKVLAAAGGLLVVIILIAALTGGDKGKDTAGAGGNGDANAGAGQAPAGGDAAPGNGQPPPTGRSQAETAAYQTKSETEALRKKASDQGAFRTEMSTPDGQYRDGTLSMQRRDYQQAQKHFADAQAGYRLALDNAQKRAKENDDRFRGIMDGAPRF